MKQIQNKSKPSDHGKGMLNNKLIEVIETHHSLLNNWC